MIQEDCRLLEILAQAQMLKARIKKETMLSIDEQALLSGETFEQAMRCVLLEEGLTVEKGR